MKKIAALFLWLLLSACHTYQEAQPRPSEWAQKVAVKNIGNLHQVSPTLYRSERPVSASLPELRRLGIKTILSLQSFHSNDALLEKSGIKNEQLTVKAWHPEEKEVRHFLKLVTDPANQPMLVHCYHGSDRTGAMCAAYRVVVQGWSKEAAISEMKYGGYGFHKIWSNLPKWVEDLDVEALQAEL